MSPVKNPEGNIIGASKIARDITERRRAEQQQRLLLREMDHRIKNLFAVASGVVALSARSATTPKEMASAVRDRLMALAQAHALTLPKTVRRWSSSKSIDDVACFDPDDSLALRGRRDGGARE